MLENAESVKQIIRGPWIQPENLIEVILIHLEKKIGLAELDRMSRWLLFYLKQKQKNLFFIVYGI